MNTFEDFLVDCLGRAAAADITAQVRLMPRLNEKTDKVEFYAHLQGLDSDTFDAEVSGKHVRNVAFRNEVEVEDFPPPMTEEELAEASAKDVGAALDAEDDEHIARLGEDGE